MRSTTILRAAQLLRSPARRRQTATVAGALGLAAALLVGALLGAGAQSGGYLAAALAALALLGGLAGGLVGLFSIRTAESARHVRSGFWISDKCEALVLDVSDRAPVRINIIHPSVDLKHFFGGFIAVFNLAVKLADRGHNVRLIALERSDLPADWRERIGEYEGMGGGIADIEIEIAANREVAIDFNPDDRLIATHWTAAHVAATSLQDLNTDRFLYLIQEYEPFIFPMSSAAALARASYDLPHAAMFSTGLLRDWFAENRIGVFGYGIEAGGARSITFDNAITPVGPGSASDLDRPGPRRLAFYARPEQHASRNLFEIGAMALDRVLAEGHFQDWDLAAIGTVDLGGGSLEMPRSGAKMKVVPRSAQADYGELLARFDVGLSLMYTPHPSLVPIEMAAAGMLTVTNSFETKTPEVMAEISPNLITVSPGPDDIADGLRLAAKRVVDHSERIKGARVEWSSDWERTFSSPVMAEIHSMLDEC